MSAGLTPRQARGLAFIRGFIETRGHAPSYREMAEGLGYTSTAPVHALVHRLRDRGHIAIAARAHRNIEVITPAPPSDIIKTLCEALERLLHPSFYAGTPMPDDGKLAEDRAFAESVLERVRKLCPK